MYDLTGQRFGRLEAIQHVGSNKNHQAVWLCRCDCGNQAEVVSQYLRNGDTKSCGCLQREGTGQRMTTHGHSKTRLHRVWVGIKNRCYNPKTDNYKYYGAKGITMCDEWKNSFESFMEWSMQNGYDPNAKAQECTIDRIDNNKGYYPENCRWVDHTYQCNNQSSNKVFTYNGETKTMAEWARTVGMKYTTLRARIRRGMPFEEAITKSTQR